VQSIDPRARIRKSSAHSRMAGEIVPRRSISIKVSTARHGRDAGKNRPRSARRGARWCRDRAVREAGLARGMGMAAGDVTGDVPKWCDPEGSRLRLILASMAFVRPRRGSRQAMNAINHRFGIARTTGKVARGK
jgi:hypothetical protein